MTGARGGFPGSGVDAFVDAYEEAQARDGRADLSAFLPDPDHPLYPAVLCELVRVDLEYGWTRGRPRRLEEYRSEYPALFRDPDRLRQVAYEEWRLRRQAGEVPPPGEYRRRFGIEDFGGSSIPRPVGEDGEPADTLAGLGGTGQAAELIRTLREVDPGTAEKVADALRMLPEPGSEFAGFRLIRELGRGAIGRVYLASQGDLADRRVALKVSADLVGEPQAMAQLQHTHVVPIYSSHRVGPLRAVCMPYFGATTLVDVLDDLRGRDEPPASGAAILDSLARLHDDDPAPAPEKPAGPATAALQTLGGLGYVQAVLWIGARLADGLAHAHERGIVHRDLKPANVLLTDDGQPMLLDFNLSADTKRADGAAAALIGGTLPYMAPEALKALRTGPQPADPRGDLYALGLILFEMLTGRHPFPTRRGPLDDVLGRMVGDRLGPPPRLRPLNPAVSPATESIVLRCLEPDPDRRYQDARHLQEDLQRQLDDRPLRHAPEPSLRERARKWARRHPRLTSGTVLGAVAAVLAAGLVIGYGRWYGPMRAELALRQFAEAHEEALVHLLDPSGDPARIEEGIAACRRALGRYGVLDSPSWARSALVRYLPGDDQARVRAGVGEVLMFWARALARQADGQDPSRRAELVRDALRWNALAEACYGPGEAPRILWAQRSGLAELAGDRDGAARARERARAAPVRSLREYAMLTIDGPGREAPADALPTLAEASRRDPKDFALWMNLGQCHALRGRLGEAEDCFTVAIVLRPQSPWPYFHRGRVGLARKQFEQARLDFDRALRLREGLVPAIINRALARIGQGDDAGAIADLTSALDRGASETRIYFIRAEARARSGDRGGADRDRAEGLRLRPADPESWVVRGLARLPGDPSGALSDFDEALRLDPRSRPALQNKAVVLSEHLGRPAEGVQALDRVVALEPDYVPARVGRGVLLARLGRRQDAHRDAEEALRRDPSGDTTYRVACIYALTARAEPDDRPRALRTLASALGQGGRWVDLARTDPDLDLLRDLDEFRDLLRAFSD
jgi:eukaryotic-like serine/threonine-protein kinase